MEEIFSSFLPSDWTSVLLSLISLLLTVITLIVANNIPKALSRYRFEKDFMTQFDEMIATIGKAKKYISSVEDFIKHFNNIDSFLIGHKKFFSYEIRLRIVTLHRRYVNLSNKMQDENSDSIGKSNYLKLLDDYRNLLSYIKFQIGGNTDEKK